jgi:hypothetical protein
MEHAITSDAAALYPRSVAEPLIELHILLPLNKKRVNELAIRIV